MDQAAHQTLPIQPDRISKVGTCCWSSPWLLSFTLPCTPRSACSLPVVNSRLQLSMSPCRASTGVRCGSAGTRMSAAPAAYPIRCACQKPCMYVVAGSAQVQCRTSCYLWSQVMTVDIQTGDRHSRDSGIAPDLAPSTPPRAQGATPLKRTLQKRLAARRAMGVIAEGAALGAPAGSERPYFKVGSPPHVPACLIAVNRGTP